MKRPAVAVEPERDLSSAAEQMLERNVGAVLVVRGDSLVGILTERDLLRALDDDVDPSATSVGVYMTPQPITVAPEATASEAAEAMVQRHIRHLPVLDTEGRIGGVVSIRDVLAQRVTDARDRQASEPW